MREMKDSGIDIINVIPTSWNLCRLKYLCKIETGDSDTQDADPDGEYPFYVRSPIIERSSAYTFDGEGILMAGDGVGAGRVFHHAFGKYAVHQRVYRLSKFSNVNSDFLFYYLQNLFDQEMDKGSAQSTVPSVRLPMLHNFNVSLPDITEQERIACFLDNKCSELEVFAQDIQSQIDLLAQYKQSVISEAVNKGLDNSLPMKDSGVVWIREIPAHWKISRIKYEIFPLQRPVMESDEVITCFRDGEVTLRKNRREEGFTFSITEHGYQGVEVGDLVIHGMDAFAGSIGCSDSRGKCTPVVHVCKTTGDNRYFMYFLRNMAYTDVFMDFAEGIRVRSSDFRNFAKLGRFDIVVPPLAEQQAIAAYLDEKCAEIDAIIADKQKQLDTLGEYKKSMIYEYVTGKKEIPA